MDSDNFKLILDCMPLVQSIISFLSLIVGVVLSYLVYKATKTFSQIQFKRSIFDAWMNLDSFLLSQPKMMAKYKEIITPHNSDGSARNGEKYLLIFMILNPLNSIYEGSINGFVDKESLEKIKPMLTQLLKDDDVFQVTQESSFSSGFSDFCKSVRDGRSERECGLPRYVSILDKSKNNS